MKLVFLPRPGDVNRDWLKVEPLIERCVSDAVKGEYDATDIKLLAEAGHVLLFYVDDEGTAVIAGALELVRYPRMLTVNVMALAGERLEELAEVYFPEIKRFARDFLGARYIEASASPAMARLLKRLGGDSAYNVVRFPLERAAP